MSTLSNIRNCLYSSEPQLFDLPAEFPVPSDPVSWSHSVCTAHPGAISVEAMPQTIGVVVEDPGRAVTLASDAAPELVRKVLTGISRGAAAHASMPLWHADSFVERVAERGVAECPDTAARLFPGAHERAVGRVVAECCHHSPLSRTLSASRWLADMMSSDNRDALTG